MMCCVPICLRDFCYILGQPPLIKLCGFTSIECMCVARGPGEMFFGMFDMWERGYTIESAYGLAEFSPRMLSAITTSSAQVGSEIP